MEFTEIKTAWRRIDNPKPGDGPLPCHIIVGDNFDWISDALIKRIREDAKWSFTNGYHELCVIEHKDYSEMTCICDKNGKILKSGWPYGTIVTQKLWISTIPGILEKHVSREPIRDMTKLSIFSDVWDDWEICDI